MKLTLEEALKILALRGYYFPPQPTYYIVCAALRDIWPNLSIKVVNNIIEVKEHEPK